MYSRSTEYVSSNAIGMTSTLTVDAPSTIVSSDGKTAILYLRMIMNMDIPVKWSDLQNMQPKFVVISIIDLQSAHLKVILFL